MLQKPKVIGLVGAAGVGKSAFARELVLSYGYTRMSLADPLKLMLRQLLTTWGYNQASCDFWIDGEGKEKPCPALQRKTPRRALQLMGTEYGRQGLGDRVWIDHLARRILNRGPDIKVVIDDIRFDNEANAFVMQFDALIGRVVTAHGKAPRRNPEAHASEAGVDESLIDFTLTNNFTFEGVREELRNLEFAA